MTESTHLRPEDRAERVFVTSIWLIMSAALLAYVAYFGRNLPYQDDWELVPVLAGADHFSLSWLLELSQEHRYILGKALLYPIFLASGGDFRSAMWVSALILIALAYSYQHVARSLRGRASFTDAFFPLLLLHWGHHESLFFFVQLWFVLPVALFSIAMMSIVTGWWQSRWGVLVLCVCVTLLPLNAAMGLLLAPALAAWMGYAAWNRRATATIAWPLSIASVVTLLLAALYFVHYQSPVRIERAPRTLLAILHTTLEVLGVSFGPGASDLWLFLGLGIAGLCGATGLALGIVALRRGEERLRAAGLIACLAATGLLALAIGYGRSILGPGAGSASRYCLLMVPTLCLVFFTATLYAGKFRGHLVEMTLFVVICAMFSVNVQTGLAYAHHRDTVADALLADIADGTPPQALAQRYFTAIYPDRNLLAARLAMLRSARTGPYRSVADSALAPVPSCREMQLPTNVIASNQVEFNGDSALGIGIDPFVVYALPQAIRVCGIKIHYSVDNSTSVPPTTQVFWRLSAAGENFDGTQRNAVVTLPPGEQTTTFWIYGKIDHFRFDPDVRPCKFRVIDITFLVED